MTRRGLSPAEIRLAQSVFGDAIDYPSVRLISGKWWPFQPRQIVMASRGHIHFHPDSDLFCDDFCEQPLAEQGLFLHEMTHVWQHQAGINLLWKRLPFARYRYELMPGKPLRDYGLEQQAEIVRHYFLLRSGVQLPHLPPRTAYDALLPIRRS